MSPSIKVVLVGAVSTMLACGPVVHAATSIYREVEGVKIAEQAKAAEGTQAGVCTAFKLTSARVLKILRNAREVDSRTYAKDLDAAPCSVEGSVTLRNGLVGKWQIEMSGRGRIEFEDRHIMLIHCPHCGAPFVQ